MAPASVLQSDTERRHPGIARWTEERLIVRSSTDSCEEYHSPIDEDDPKYGLLYCLSCGQLSEESPRVQGRWAYPWNISVGLSALASGDCHQLCATVIHRSQYEGLSKAIYAVGERAWVRPVTETNIIPANGSRVAQNGEQESNADADDLPQSKPVLQLPIHDNSAEGNALVEEPTDQDPAISWHFVGPVRQDNRNEVVLSSNVGCPLDTYQLVLPFVFHFQLLLTRYQ